MGTVPYYISCKKKKSEYARNCPLYLVLSHLFCVWMSIEPSPFTFHFVSKLKFPPNVTNCVFFHIGSCHVRILGIIPTAKYPFLISSKTTRHLMSASFPYGPRTTPSGKSYFKSRDKKKTHKTVDCIYSYVNIVHKQVNTSRTISSVQPSLHWRQQRRVASLHFLVYLLGERLVVVG